MGLDEVAQKGNPVPMSRIERLREALKSRRGEYADIVAATNLSYWWLSKFARGVIADPGASKLDALEGWLASHSENAGEAAA